MKPLQIGIGAICLFLFFVSCGRESDVVSQIQKAQSELDGDELFLRLLELNEAYPASFHVKLVLGNLLIERGDPRSAEIFLASALRSERRCTNREEQAELRGLLALASLETGESAKGASLAHEAFELDPLPRYTLIEGRALFHGGDTEGAGTPFTAAYSQDKALFGSAESREYAALLAATEKPEEALLVLRESMQRNGYYPGGGMEESSLCSALGRKDEALLSAFRDLEYIRQMEDGEKAASKAFLTLKALYKDSEARIIQGMELYLAERYREAYSVLSQIPQALSHSMLSYVLLACRLECGEQNSSDLDAYIGLEQEFKTHQLYYHHLYRAVKGEELLSLPSYTAIISRCMSLGEESRYGVEARRELSGLLAEP